MLMQNSGVTNKEHYGMLWSFLEWSIKPKHDWITDSAMPTHVTATLNRT